MKADKSGNVSYSLPTRPASFRLFPALLSGSTPKFLIVATMTGMDLRHSVYNSGSLGGRSGTKRQKIEFFLG